jgi:uncharacterized damage-inducible protein DinB
MTMTKPYIIFARHNAEANEKIISIVGKCSPEEREKERGSYYGSLSGLLSHILGGVCFFGGLFGKALEENAAAKRALADLAAIRLPAHSPVKLDEKQWQSLAADIRAADKAYIALTEALTDGDLDAPVALDWYGGKPATVPLSFMLQQLVSHNIHHRGQISQILDELKIENDYSGINVAFLTAC